MQAVILAAGFGSRLADYTKNNTKCMVEVNGIRLIDRMLDSLCGKGLTQLVIVAGYKSENLMKYIGDSYKGLPVFYVNNKDYASTNNIYSLYLARDFLKEDDTLLLESDLIFEESMIDFILNVPDKENSHALVAKYESWMDGTVLELDGEHDIRSFIKKEDFCAGKADEYYKTINIYRFTKEFSKNMYLPFLEAFIASFGVNAYYEEVLRILNFIDKKVIKALVADKSLRWYEIDNKEDLDAASRLFREKG